MTWDKFDWFRANCDAMLRELNPTGSLGPNNQNCPLVAYSVNEYFSHRFKAPVPAIGRATTINLRPDPATLTFNPWIPRSARAPGSARNIARHVLNHGNHIVVQGQRSAADCLAENLTPDHWFNVIKIRRDVCVVDGFGRPPTALCETDMDAYMARQLLTSYAIPSRYLAWIVGWPPGSSATAPGHWAAGTTPTTPHTPPPVGGDAPHP